MEAVRQVRVALVRDARRSGEDRITISRPTDVVPMLADIAKSDRENFVVLHLDARNQLNSMEIVSIGSLNASLVHPREVWKGAILANAASIILAHNHPSGDPTPSREDIELTGRLKQSAEIMGVDLLDHLVVAPGGRHISMKEANLM